MTGLLIIFSYTGILAWMLPPLRQYKTKHFLYFLLLAISDPITVILYKVGVQNVWQVHVLFSTVWILALLKLKNKRLYILIFSLAVLLVISILFLGVSKKIMYNIVAVNDLLITILIAKDFILYIRETETISMYYIILILYNLANFIKALFRDSHGETGYLYFLVTSIFQIFLAIYFTRYNEENSRKFSLIKETIPREV